MPGLDDILSGQFQRWERRGRGWTVHSHPVATEPPFQPFPGYRLPTVPDDGRRETVLSHLWQKLAVISLNPAPALTLPEVEELDTAPCWRGELVELHATLPDKGTVELASLWQRMTTVEPVAFELLAVPEIILTQFAAHETDADWLRRQFQIAAPEVSLTPYQANLAEAWAARDDGETAVVEFGLEREFPLSLNPTADPFAGLIAAMHELRTGEMALYQVLFEPTRQPWREQVWKALTGPEEEAVFANTRDLLAGARQKCSQPLFGVVVRLVARAPEFDRAWQIVREMAMALRGLSSPEGNALIPLRNDDYPFEDHLEDVVRRQSRRSGMLLSLEELTALVHLPGAEIQSRKLRPVTAKTKAAPLQPASGLLLGTNQHGNQNQPIRLTPEQRVRHAHLIGASGTGKSTLLLNLITQDLANGAGFAVLDPHGDLIEQVLARIPDDRVDDVILLDPADVEYAVAFNILTAHNDLEKSLLASDLVAVFQRLSSSWGEQMESVLRNAILAFLESSQGGTLADLRRFLLDATFRNQFLKTVTDPELVYYWQKGFPQLSGNRSIGPVLTRLETFLAPKPLRAMVSQKVNRLDFRGMLDGGKILLAKLSQGLIGRENAHLLGSLLMARLQQAAMSRQSQREAERRDFMLYVDEFQNFITPSLTEILTGARKYRLGLVLAHQELRQLERDRDVASAVLSNTATRIVFKVSDEEARKLAEGFSSFEARDLQNLGVGEAICRLGKSDADFNLAIQTPEPVDPDVAAERGARAIAASRLRYGTPRAEVEAQNSTPPVEPAPASPLLTRVTEVPKVTGSEKQPAPIAAKAEPTATAPTATPSEPGRGGEQHKAIQHRIKAAAEALGFRATVEKEVLEGDGSVDLALERADIAIACEVAITTTIDHEFGNVKKCLKAGFTQVAVISSKPERLEQIAQAVQGGLGAEAAAKVGYFSADEFIRHLQRLPLPEPPPEPATTPTEKTTLGFKVRRHGAKLAPEERRAKEAAAMQMIADTLKPKME